MGKKATQNNILAFPQHLGGAADDLINDDDLLDDDLIDGDDDDDGGVGHQFQSQLESLRSTVEQNNQNTQNLMMQLLAGNRNNQQTQQGAATDQGNPLELDFDDLPDPVTDRAGFNKAIAKKVGGAISTISTNLQRQSSSAATVNQLEVQFAEKFPKLKGKPILLRAAVQDTLQSFQSAGIDPAQGVMMDQAGFLNKVAGKMASELGIDLNAQDDDDADDDGAQHLGGRSGKPANRTGGLGAGSGTKVRKKAKDRQPTGFLDQHKKLQADMGLY